MRLFLLVLSLLACSAPARLTPPPSISTDAALAAMIDPVVEQAAAEGFAGQVALMRDGVFVYQRAAGAADRGGRVPVTLETRFHTASIAKYFTAALTLAAADEDRLDLDQEIASLFPGLQITAPGVTVADLLAHRSGLGSSYAAEQLSEADEAAAAIAAQPYDATRAGAFHYSNDAYDLLAIVLERAYGVPYEQALRDTLVARAGLLDRIAFWGEVDLTDPHAVAQPTNGFSRRLRGRNYGMLGSAGLLISASDLARWEYMLRQGDLLSAAARDELYAPRGGVSIGQAAFGTFLVERPELGRIIRALGYEDWGDNASLNDYIDCGYILAVVTSRGPPERSGRPPFRESITGAIEPVLAERCAYL